ncbi:MAG: adenosine deaminase [Chloroflexi bacterium]|nr:adenosine deaminase [Chloroflexota bacterium]
MRATTLTELADRHGLPANLEGDGSFASFIALYRAACEALRSPDDLSRLVHEIVEDATADGVVWIEISAWVSSAHAERLGLANQVEVLEALLDAGQRAQRKAGIGVGFIVSANRTRPPTEAVELARLAAKHTADGVVGLGLADDETRGAAELFGEAFAVARDAGLIRAPHAGEHGGPDSVRGALDVLGAQRIEHGVRSVEDPELLRRLAAEGVTLDVCPTSNVVLSVVPSLDAHPLPRLLEAGVPLSLNADDPLFFGSGILAEYELGRHSFGLDDLTLAHIARCSIRASGAPDKLKTAALAAIDRWSA